MAREIKPYEELELKDDFMFDHARSQIRKTIFGDDLEDQDSKGRVSAVTEEYRSVCKCQSNTVRCVCGR